MDLIAAELARAEAARAAGQEGRARVCARRAAGWAARVWHQRQGGADWGGDALRQLLSLRAADAAPAAVRAAAQRLTTTVDAQHRLPFPEDPLADARAVIAFALSEETP